MNTLGFSSFLVHTDGWTAAFSTLTGKNAFSHSVLIYILSDFQMPKPSLLILLSGHTYERSAIAKWLEALRNFDSIRSWEEGNVDRENESQLNLYEKKVYNVQSTSMQFTSEGTTIETMINTSSCIRIHTQYRN